MKIAQKLKVGLMNDLHYDGGVQALNLLYEAVSSLNHGEAELLVVMGDLIDSNSESNARRLLREVSALCDSFRGTVRYMPGNHDLDHISKAEFYNALGHAGDAPTGRFQHGGLEFICIDGNFSPDGTEYDHGNFDWKEAYVPDEQLVWLGGELAAAKASVVILSHQRIDIPCMYSVQNHAAVRDVLRLSGKVKAVFQGHQHADDLQQIDGITYYTLSAHKDDAGPAVVHIDSRGIRLVRDFQAVELV
jgi:UDP-2,3-diacylglucosamine pyrophosphatase LpxH